MKILFLCEGDAETQDSWSGVSQSVVRHLREAGHTVIPGDVDLYGLPRILVATRTAGYPRKRWWARYHLSRHAFRARSRKAARIVRKHAAEVDLVLQIGATFRVDVPPDVPLVLYCDSHIELSRAGAASGHSEAAALTPAEIDEIRGREATVYVAAELIFTMSHLLRRSFIDDFGLDPEGLVTIHCAPNIDLREWPGRSTADENGPPTVLFVGRDFGRKGGDLLIQAFPEVRRHVPDARLRIVGAQPRGEWPEWIEFTGYLDRDTVEGREAMERAYRTSTLFCLPTRFEPFGTSFVEAMGYQLPCVGPDAWAVPEIIVDGETGLIVPPENCEALSDGLVRLLTDRELAGRMGRAGRARALECFSWPDIVSRMAQAMDPLVAGGRSAE